MDDTLTSMADKALANNFLSTLNHCHSSVKFTIDIEHNGMLPFLCTQLLKKSIQIKTKAYVQPWLPTPPFRCITRAMFIKNYVQVQGRVTFFFFANVGRVALIFQQT